MPAFTIGEAINQGWLLTKTHWKALLTFFGINLLLQIPGNAFNNINENDPSLFISLISLVISLVTLMVSINWLRIGLGLLENQPYTLNDFFKLDWKTFWQYLIATVIFSVVGALGFIFLIVPGIIIAISWGQFPMVVVDKGYSAWEAIKESSRITKGNRMKLFLLGLAFFGLALASVFTLFLGLIILEPVSTMASLWVYRQLSNAANPNDSTPVLTPAV